MTLLPGIITNMNNFYSKIVFKSYLWLFGRMLICHSAESEVNWVSDIEGVQWRVDSCIIYQGSVFLISVSCFDQANDAAQLCILIKSGIYFGEQHFDETQEVVGHWWKVIDNALSLMHAELVYKSNPLSLPSLIRSIFSIVHSFIRCLIRSSVSRLLEFIDALERFWLLDCWTNCIEKIVLLIYCICAPSLLSIVALFNSILYILCLEYSS